jgi:S1-C subfamily serine protease
MRLTLVSVVLLSVSATAAGADYLTRALLSVVYYGEPTRVISDQLESEAARQVVQQSVLMLVPESHLDIKEMRWMSKSVAAQWGICDNHPLAHEAAIATCSGVLISDMQVVTAAHCVPGGACKGFLLAHVDVGDAPDKPMILDVTHCHAVHHWDAERDLAIIELARPLDSPSPARWCDASLGTNERVTACGASFGAIPQCDPDGLVVGPGRVHADLAVGSSGGPLIDTDGFVRAIALDGAPDLVWNGSCFDEAHPAANAAGEGFAELRDLRDALKNLSLTPTCDVRADSRNLAPRDLDVRQLIALLFVLGAVIRWRTRKFKE